MDVEILFKIAGVGIITAVVVQLLKHLSDPRQLGRLVQDPVHREADRVGTRTVFLPFLRDRESVVNESSPHVPR